MGSQHRDASLEEWKELLDKFTDQKAMFDAIPLAASVGIFAANNQRIKDLFLPSPSRCLADIHRTLPEIGQTMAAKLLNETTYAQEKLNHPPDNVADFVEYSSFLASTNERQPEFSERGQGVRAICAEPAPQP